MRRKQAQLFITIDDWYIQSEIYQTELLADKFRWMEYKPGMKISNQVFSSHYLSLAPLAAWPRWSLEAEQLGLMPVLAA